MFSHPMRFMNSSVGRELLWTHLFNVYSITKASNSINNKVKLIYICP